MNKRRYRSVLVLGTVGLLLTGVCGLWLWSYQRQEALNRQLIVALVHKDITESIILVNDGADPNTPYKPLPRLSLRQLWNHLLHHEEKRHDDKPTAFLIACGAIWFEEDQEGGYDRPDAPQLVLAMLRHGANRDSKDADGFTPLCWAVWANNPQTLRVLLDHGAKLDAEVFSERLTPLMMASHFSMPEIVKILLDHGANVNATDSGGHTALHHCATSAIMDRIFRDQKGLDNYTKVIIPQLLAHGADPNIPDGREIPPCNTSSAATIPFLTSRLSCARQQ